MVRTPRGRPPRMRRRPTLVRRRLAPSLKISGRKTMGSSRGFRLDQGVERRQVWGGVQAYRRLFRKLQRHEPTTPAAVVAPEQTSVRQLLPDSLRHTPRVRSVHAADMAAWTRLLVVARDLDANGSRGRHRLLGI